MSDTYTFTSNQLHALLTDTIGMYNEYINVHGYDKDRAQSAAVLEMLEGLDAEKELVAAGEQFTHSQIIEEGG